MSRRPDGRRGRRKPDPAEETASWLLEIEQAGQTDDEEEEDWAGTLRATRRGATGQFPPVPTEGPAGGAPPPTERSPQPAPPPSEQGNWFTSERPAEQAGQDTGSWGGTPATPTWGGADPGQRPAPGAADPQLGSQAPWRQPETSGVAEPPREPQAWDTQAGAEPVSGGWPFEDAGQSWEPDDRSYSWPAQELPATTGSWEAEPASAPSEDLWATPQRGGYSGAPGYEASPGYQAGYASPADDPRLRGDPYPTAGDPYGASGQPYAGEQFAAPEPYPGHDPFAAYGLQGSRGPYGAGEGTQAAAGAASQTPFDSEPRTGPIAAGPPPGPAGAAAARPATPPTRPEIWPPQTGGWQIDEPPPRPRPAVSGEFSRLLESDEEQVVRLGRSLDDPDGSGTGPLDHGSRVRPGRSSRPPAARLVDDGHHVSHRPRWPRVVALISWIILLMVVCWFYVFPWLEKILPESF